LPLLTPIVSIEVHEAIAGVQKNNANIVSNADPHQLAIVPSPGNDAIDGGPGSDALDAQTLWIFAAVRALNQPKPSNLAAGAAVFSR
jgi:hypothetical protein